MNNQGTPRTLEEAIKRALLVGPINQIVGRAHFVLKDFMAQKFSVAYLRMGQYREGSSTWFNPEEILERLFEDLTCREGEIKQGGSMILEVLELERLRTQKAIDETQEKIEASDANDAHTAKVKGQLKTLNDELEVILRNIERFKNG